MVDVKDDVRVGHDVWAFMDGNIVRVDWDSKTVHVAIPEPIEVVPWERYTKHERRGKARQGKRGRRGARRVSVWRIPGYPVSSPINVIAYERHLFHDGRGGHVWCYLPSGVKSSEAVCRALEKAMRHGGAMCPPWAK